MQERDAVARLKRGDIGGLDPLVRQHYTRALRTAYLITRDRALAEDVVQESFVRAYERISQLDPARPFGPWFLRSVVNRAIDTVSRRERQTSLDARQAGDVASFLEMLPDPAAGPAELSDQSELRRVVWDALGELPARERAAVIMRYYLGMSEAEMAREMEVAPGTVKWRLHNARERLRSLLRPLWLG